MPVRTILVTGVGGDIGQSVIKCLKESFHDAKIVGCDMDPYAAGRALVANFYTVPAVADSKSYQSSLRGIVAAEKVGYILPVTEQEIAYFDRARDSYPSSRLLVADHHIVDTFSDKYKTALFFLKHGLPHPKTFLIQEFDGQLTYPVLIKRKRGWGAKGMYVVRNNDEMLYHKKTCPDSIVQEIVGSDDEEYTVGIFSDGSAVCAIAFKRVLGYGSLTKCAVFVRDDALETAAKDIAGILRLRGPLNVQFRKTSQGYVPFEVNPRLSSTVYVRHHFGFEDVRWWIDMCEGRGVTYAPQYRAGVAVRTISEVFFDMEKGEI